jgi:hypothetical protein
MSGECRDAPIRPMETDEIAESRYLLCRSGAILYIPPASITATRPIMNTYAHYLKAALLSQVNIVYIVGMGLFSLVTWNPVPALIGAIGEAAWLGAAPLTSAFRRMADRRAEKYQAFDREEEVKRLLASLPASEHARFSNMTGLVRDIKATFKGYTGSNKVLLDASSERIDEMLVRYTKLLGTRAQYRAFVEQADADDIERKITSLETEIEGADERLREVKQRQMEILRQRQSKAEKAGRDMEVIDAQLDTFEDLVKLFKEQAISLTSPADFATQLNGLVTQMQVTESTVADLDSSFDLFDRELRNAEEKRPLTS